MKTNMTTGRKGRLICFVGIDGSGKTTQAKLLTRVLNQKGIKSRYVWNRYEPRLIKPFVILGKLLFFRGKDSAKNYAAYSATKKSLFKNPLIAKAYQYFLLFEYLCQTQIKIRLPLILGKNIVCDRYIHDEIADLTVDFGYTKEEARIKLENLSRWLPRPNITFLLDVPIDVAHQRKDDVPLALLAERRKAYQNIAKEQGIAVVDSSQSSAELESLIKSIALEVSDEES